MSNEVTTQAQGALVIRRKPVEALTCRFEHFSSEEAKQQHLQQVAEAQRNHNVKF